MHTPTQSDTHTHFQMAEALWLRVALPQVMRSRRRQNDVFILLGVRQDGAWMESSKGRTNTMCKRSGGAERSGGEEEGLEATEECRRKGVDNETK